jgi:hypothetical protein
MKLLWMLSMTFQSHNTPHCTLQKCNDMKN